MKLSFFEDLTKEQRRNYGNGCGPKLLCLDKLIPEFEWNFACREHDFYYDCGGNKKDREWADKNFRKKMRQQLMKNGNFLQKIILLPVVELYYQAVRYGGENAFYYGPYLTLKQLIYKAEKKYGIKL